MILVQSNLDKEVKEIVDQLCFYFIQVQVSGSTLHTIADLVSIVQEKFTNRFIRNNPTTHNDSWIGLFRFTYGDVLFDQKYDKRCIVLNEHEVFLIVWYYVDGSTNDTFRRRNKNDTRLMMVKRSLLE